LTAQGPLPNTSGRASRSRPSAFPSTGKPAEGDMSKGMDQKKSEKKAPAKSLKEKRADKQEKKKSK
jgi:hypothetical protein